MIFQEFIHYLRYQIRRLRLGRFVSIDWWMSNIPEWLTPGFYWRIIVSPLSWLIGLHRQRELRQLLYGIPAILLFVVALFAIHLIRQQKVVLSEQYWVRSQEAVARSNFNAAKILLERVIRENRGRVNDARFALAEILEQEGSTEQAEALFLALAPDDKRGFRAAHKRLAYILSNSISEESSKDELFRLRWHLDNASDQDSAVMSLSWGRFWLAMGDLNLAREKLIAASIEFPEIYITLGEIDAKLGNTERALENYERAATYLASQITSQPTKTDTRRDLATVLIRLNRLDDARIVLEDGLRLDPQGNWNQLLAALYVAYHDLLASQGTTDLGDLLLPIATSLQHEPNFAPALVRLLGFASVEVEGNVPLKEVLAKVCAEGKQPAMAHLAIGNIFWKEGDTAGAIFHFERALKINQDLAVVMNNLAWLLSFNSSKPDIDRALSLIGLALKQDPNNGSFLDTRGSIYLLSEKYPEALDDFEKALPTVVDKAAVHRKLAVVYEKLGRPEMAKQHTLLEQELRGKTTTGTANNTQP